jgi:hypothetical protein
MLQKKNNPSLRSFLTLYFFTCVSLYAAVYARPTSHILNVPYFRQATDFACGDASLQMLLAYWGIDVSQYSLIDVMRTTIAEGN